MKKLLLLSFVLPLFFSSCYTLNYGGKKPFFIVDAPRDLLVTANDEAMNIDNYTAFRSEQNTGGNTKTVTYYKYPGFLLKLKKQNKLVFGSGGKTKTVGRVGTPAIVALVFEGLFTFGIGAIIDIATGSYRYSKERFIDVPAIFNGSTPRTQKELKKYVKKQF